jgi:hypothetical protein
MTDVIADSRFRTKGLAALRTREKPLGAKGPPLPRPIPKPRPKAVVLTTPALTVPCERPTGA